MLARTAAAIAVTITIALNLHAPAAAQSAAAARNAIQQAYNKRDVAAGKKDIQGSLSTVAPDFVFVTKDGQKGDVKLLKRRLTPLFSLMQSVKSHTEIQKLTVKGSTATAIVKQHLEMLVVNPQTQIPQKFIADATSEDIWSKAGAGWLQKRMTNKSETATLDGKSVDEQLKLGAGKSGAGSLKKKK